MGRARRWDRARRSWPRGRGRLVRRRSVLRRSRYWWSAKSSQQYPDSAPTWPPRPPRGAPPPRRRRRRSRPGRPSPTAPRDTRRAAGGDGDDGRVVVAGDEITGPMAASSKCRDGTRIRETPPDRLRPVAPRSRCHHQIIPARRDLARHVVAEHRHERADHGDAHDTGEAAGDHPELHAGQRDHRARLHVADAGPPWTTAI